MQRLKVAKNLNIRQGMLVDNAYYFCRPPERVAVEKKQLTPLQHFIRHLVHERLAEDEPKQVRSMFSEICVKTASQGYACTAHYTCVAVLLSYGMGCK